MPPNKKKPGPKTDMNNDRLLSDAEGELWNKVMDGVEPLGDIGADFVPGQEPGAPAPGTPPPGKIKAKKKNTATLPRTPSLSSPPAPERAEPDLVHGKAPGLDRRSQTKLRRGQVDIEARIDLHGLTQDRAHRALEGFLDESRTAGRRTVLVITGKGGDGEGVLRNAVPKWLNETTNREMIRGFSHAAPKHGGAGALYVLLKRQK